jgi:hypothetical protein
VNVLCTACCTEPDSDCRRADSATAQLYQSLCVSPHQVRLEILALAGSLISGQPFVRADSYLERKVPALVCCGVLSCEQNEPCIGHSLASSEEETKKIKKLVPRITAVRMQGGSQGMTRFGYTSSASE